MQVMKKSGFRKCHHAHTRAHSRSFIKYKVSLFLIRWYRCNGNRFTHRKLSSPANKIPLDKTHYGSKNSKWIKSLQLWVYALSGIFNPPPLNALFMKTAMGMSRSIKKLLALDENSTMLNINKGGSMYQKSITIAMLLLGSFTFSVLADDTKELERQWTESLGKSCTQEQRAWYEAQYEQYIKCHPATPLKRYRHYTFCERRQIAGHDSRAVTHALVLINKTLYADQRAKEKIDRYLADIGQAHGCKVSVEVLEGGTAESIKNLIKQYYTAGGLDGVIQIGSLPAAWFYDADPQYGGNFTCDLFYMDLNGNWIDKDNNGKYDAHEKGSGDKCPEIFYGRIDPGTMGSYGTEVDLLCAYMDKNHSYWMNSIPLKKSALAYIEKDWANSTNTTEKIYGLSNTEVLRYGTNTVSKADYTANRLTKDYSFLHMWCHSGYNAHSFTTGGSLGHAEIMNIKPKPIGYAHDGCHCADWAAGGGKGYTAGAYVYSKSPTSLVCVSGTKTGQWIGLKGKLFFEELGKNTCVGQAFKIWFADYIKREGDSNVPYFILWNYGYVILGDPMLGFISVPATGLNKEILQPVNTNYLDCNTLVNGRQMSISYTIPLTALVEMKLYDVSGREIHTMINKTQHQGNYTVTAAINEIPDGTYILKLKAGSFYASKKIEVMKQ